MDKNYREMVAAFGARYLKGKTEHVHLENKFCMIDNLADGEADEEGRMHSRARALYPVRISMSFCIYCKKGRLRTRIQQKEYVLGESEVLLIFAGQIVESASLSEDCKVIFLAVDSEFILTQIRNKYGNALRNWVLRSKEPTLMHLDEANAHNYENLCQSIRFMIQDTGQDYADGIIYGFTTIFGNLLTSWYKNGAREAAEQETQAPASNAQKVFLRFQSEVYSFSYRYKRVEFYARRQHLSTRQFSRLIHEASGKRPLDVINEYLVLEAKSLLRTERYSVHQVCEKMGFDNDSFFNRWFKRFTGLTPGRYQREG